MIDSLANEKFKAALKEVADEENLKAVVRDGAALKQEDFGSKYQEFRDVTDLILLKLNSNNKTI